MTATPPALINLDDPSLYINRELSWLEFNRRVLAEGQDPNVPLMERVKFLAIFGSNLDEFFMVRVGGLQQKVQAGVTRSFGADRMPPRMQLEQIHATVRQLVDDQYRCLREEIIPALEQEGIVFRDDKQLSDSDRMHMREVFRREIFPVLTPLAIDPGHPFPHLLNKSLNLGVLLERPGNPEKLFAVVQVPGVLPRFVQLPAERGYAFTSLETVIRLHLEDLFPGMKIDDAVAFRATRDSEYEIDDEEVEDLLKAIEEEVRKSRRGDAVRLEIESDSPSEIEHSLMAALDLNPTDVYRVPGVLDLTGLFQINGLPGFAHLRDPQFAPQAVPEFSQAANIWAAIRARDILVHHPYESFNHVVDFIEAAAADDKVLAIKQTLYRTSSDSPIVRALQRAADAGKQVTAVIELKARLDEERNILWARELEKSGVHVVFGFIGLKTHCKVALVVRREDDGIRRYVHLGTGNYNPQTARIYTDIGFFTDKPDFADDVSALFNYLTGYSELPQWRKLVVAPSRLQAFLLEKIDQEIQNQQKNGNGRIIVKINGLLEPAVVQGLYRASQAGVQVDMICRGICALRPGIPGVSDNIRVISIIDRFLEHSRILYYGNNGNPEVYVGSADWMDRNLSRRVEVMFPIEQADLKHRLIHEILTISLADNTKARELMPDGTYRRPPLPAESERVRSQVKFLELAAANATRKLESTVMPVSVFIEPRERRKPRRRRSAN
ncbi:polyphosphate kinase 1 [Tuwongella immobilis]|uniref:Polyphosphate kinase n=1 Tax=Tuwongella immobilis TaxID=692036 RepID=A0A6C2YV95_9BACT|nr:polyphosphate kinase 1 [Tuwongella immobilis]VIP04835.1 polyphosphate kinase : Polyphosphate kinase OS=Hyalangium minutum GN=ppk PE=3 SV=1: PP_kinase_N: PP_kinase: PP_kinase_C [Tuwongella immobilis]VTS07030.1 polyphosphate kinase : Polyphosphate kinase OS=Hyalangium minutum GN=ppk PE=3 SV=1: PP_kinase_N: PP_kinase: PP_kinase_C [Tuwongella immobilis]